MIELCFRSDELNTIWYVEKDGVDKINNNYNNTYNEKQMELARQIRWY